MYRIRACVVSGSRAEFGQLLPLLLKMEEDKEIELDFVVTGAHLSVNSGYTISEIKESGVPVSACLEIKHFDNNTKEGIAFQISDVIKKFAEYFSQKKPDILVVIGDRYEMFGVAIAASTLLVPIAHICGGSVTSGAIDEVYRHSITKMSSLHFTTCAAYRKRVIQLGENPQTVYNVGSLAIENCLHEELFSEKQIRHMLEIPMDMPYCVVTFHPVTLERNEICEKELFALIQAMDEFSQYGYVITLSNSDSGGDRINQIWKEEASKRKNFFVVPSLGMKRYLTALKYSKMMIGNSSSGTTEAPAMHIPTIDIGDRQKGRFFADSIIHCEPEKEEIVTAIGRVDKPEFQERLCSVKNPFGDGRTSEKIVEILKEEFSNMTVKKNFYDVDFEIKD